MNEQDKDRVIRTRKINATQTFHRCIACGTLVPFGRSMMLAVATTSCSIYSTYYCMECAKEAKEIFGEAFNG